MNNIYESENILSIFLLRTKVKSIY